MARQVKTATRLTIAGVIGVAAVIAVGVTGASAGTQTKKIPVTHVIGTQTFGKTAGLVQFAGAIGDYGKGKYVNSAGHPDPAGNDYKIEMQHGSLVLNLTELNARLNSSRPAFYNTATCSGAIKEAAPTKIVSGTGSYAAAHGTFQLSVYSEFVVPRFTSGAKKGSCNIDSEPSHALSSISGQGQISS